MQDTFRFRSLGESGDYDRLYAAFDMQARPVRVFHFKWRRDGVLVLPKSAKGVGDELYRAFCDWLEAKHPQEVKVAFVRAGLSIPLELPKAYQAS